MTSHSNTALERCCITGETHEVLDMLCFVVSPTHTLTLDLSYKLPGERRWVVARSSIVQQAVAEGASGILFANTAAPLPQFDAYVAQQLKAKALQSLGLTRRAGQAVAGFEKVSRLLKHASPNAAIVIVVATNAVRLQELTGHPSTTQEFTGNTAPHVIQCLDEEELASVCGGQHIAYIGLKPHPLTCCFLRDIQRYQRYSAA
jgi:predicted RNA-binding protein YlxR (DUF448 family)